jgi:DNA-binding XRE family transcriptional regulator
VEAYQFWWCFQRWRSGDRQAVPEKSRWKRLDAQLAAEQDRVLRAIGRRLAELRAGKELTQEELAEQLGIAWKYWQRLEAGLHSLSVAQLVKLARIFDVAVTDLLRPPRSMARNPGRPPKGSTVARSHRKAVKRRR